MAQLLTAESFDAPDEILTWELRDKLAALDEDLEVPSEGSSVRELFALDDEVRNGGFAQYFFNPSCIGAIDAWFASREIDPRVHALLSQALVQLGRVANKDLDLATMVERGGPGSLGPAMRTIVEIQRSAQGASKNPLIAFQLFRDRCAGFAELDDRYFETDIDTSIAVFVRRHAAVFTAHLAAQA